MKNQKNLHKLPAVMEELTKQLMEERNLSRKDAENACCHNLCTPGHFHRLKDAIL